MSNLKPNMCNSQNIYVLYETYVLFKIHYTRLKHHLPLFMHFGSSYPTIKLSFLYFIVHGIWHMIKFWVKENHKHYPGTKNMCHLVIVLRAFEGSNFVNEFVPFIGYIYTTFKLLKRQI